VSLICGSCTEREKACPDTAVVAARGRFPSGRNRKGRSTDAGALADRLVVAVMLLLDAVEVEPRGRVIWCCVHWINRTRFGRSLGGRAEISR
jgi:hypothetical protein